MVVAKGSGRSNEAHPWLWIRPRGHARGRARGLERTRSESKIRSGN